MRKDAREHRQQIVLAARRVFARDGYRAPLEAVVSEAGLGRGTLYRHFANRHALVVALMEYELDGMIAFFVENRDSETLFEDILLRQGEIGVAASQAIQDIDDADLLDLFAPLTKRADVLYTDIVATLEQNRIIRGGLNPDIFRMLVQMVISVGRYAETKESGRKAMLEAIAIIKGGVVGKGGS